MNNTNNNSERISKEALDLMMTYMINERTKNIDGLKLLKQDPALTKRLATLDIQIYKTEGEIRILEHLREVIREAQCN